jgi:nucleotidyltransferase substrate binding protein (TIGR01987 family)
MTVKLDALRQALSTLNEALELHREHKADAKLSMALRDSVIQRFEYTYELAWKALQRFLAENVTPEAAEPVYSRKELFRQAARWGLLPDPARWFAHHEARNVSAHTCNEANAEQAFRAATAFPEDVRLLVEELEKRND